MIALKHIIEQGYTYVDIVEAAPHNVGKLGKYKGVGAHLFAIACKLSWDVGNDSYGAEHLIKKYFKEELQ